MAPTRPVMHGALITLRGSQGVPRLGRRTASLGMTEIAPPKKLAILSRGAAIRLRRSDYAVTSRGTSRGAATDASRPLDECHTKMCRRDACTTKATT